MQARTAPGTAKAATQATRIGRLLALLLPCVLLLALAVPHAGAGPVLWGSVTVLALAGLLAFLSAQAGREPVGPQLILLNILALGVLVIALPQADLWWDHLIRATFLVVPVWLFGIQCLQASGASALRYARQMAARLAARSGWPTDLMAIRQLPDVQAFREALHVDAAPALELLLDTRPAVRVAALAALEFRPTWRPGQTALVLPLARRAPEPEVRAAAVSALANIDDRGVTEAVAELLRDPSPLVRQTVSEALLWDTENRWSWLRNAVRSALADPSCQQDGPLKLGGQPLCDEAVSDLHIWAAEKGVISLRAALTLGAHYGRQLAAGAEPALLAKLREALSASSTPALLRLELARLMFQHRELGQGDLHHMLQPAMPAPVRLIAVEALLSDGRSPEALAALHDLARLPNREIALSIADVVQRRLGVDLGLPRGQPMPAVNSRLAADVARRVLVWASHHDAGAPISRAAAREADESRVELG